MSDDLYELVGLDPDDHEAREAVADARAVSDLISTLVGVRRECRLTQSVVAERMGTTQSAVSELERVASDPHISTLQRYGRAVGARIAWKVVLDGGWTMLDRHVRANAAISDETEPPPALSNTPWRPLKKTTGIRVVS
jgi:transcriptional regulator with XRE-family HTH domain